MHNIAVVFISKFNFTVLILVSCTHKISSPVNARETLYVKRKSQLSETRQTFSASIFLTESYNSIKSRPEYSLINLKKGNIAMQRRFYCTLN